MDRVDARLRVAIDDDCAVGCQRHAGTLEAEVRGVRLAAGGEEHEVGLLVRPVGVADFEAVLVLDDLRRLAAEVDGEPAVAHLVGDALTEVGVEATQQPLAAVGERGLDAEPLEDRGELERDVAGADHDRAARQALEVKGFVGGDGVLAARKRWQVRPGALPRRRRGRAGHRHPRGHARPTVNAALR